MPRKSPGCSDAYAGSIAQTLGDMNIEADSADAATLLPRLLLHPRAEPVGKLIEPGFATELNFETD